MERRKISGKKCCIPGCNSNYGNTKKYVSIFSFPRDAARKSQWLKLINSENLTLRLSSVVCIKHFKEEFIVREDRATRDDGTELVMARKAPKLTKDAYPSIFPIQPSNLSDAPPTSSKSLNDLKTAIKLRYQHASRLPPIQVENCCANNCKEKKTEDSPYSFYSFPSDERRRNKWENALNRDSFKSTENSVICSKHFEPECFMKEKSGRIWLKLDATPTIFDSQDTSKKRNAQFSDVEEKVKIRKSVRSFKEQDMICPSNAQRFFALANEDLALKFETIKQLNKENSRLAMKIKMLENRLNDPQNELSVTESAKSTLKGSKPVVEEVEDPRPQEKHDKSVVESTIRVKETPVDDYPTTSISNGTMSGDYVLLYVDSSWTSTSSPRVEPQSGLSISSLNSGNLPEYSDHEPIKRNLKTDLSNIIIAPTSTPTIECASVLTVPSNCAAVKPESPVLNLDIPTPGSSKEHHRDQFDSFASYVGNKLRSLDPISSAGAQKDMQNTILEAEMGKYLTKTQDIKPSIVPGSF